MHSSTESPVEYEFNDSQNQLIGSLAQKMALVGFVMALFGLLQLVNGVFSLFMTRNPERMIAAAQKSGIPEAQLETFKEALSGGFWSSPLTVSALVFALAGLFLFLIGLWTRQAAIGFVGIATTKGNDISRLMDALGALHRKYSAIYTVLLTIAIISLASLAVTLWSSWRGGS